MLLGSKLSPPRRSHFYIELCKAIFKRLLLLNQYGKLTTLNRNDPWWSPTKIVQTVPIGCISRSRGKKIGFQNAIFNNLLIRNYKAQSLHIWYITSARHLLPELFKLCHLGPNWPCPVVTILHWNYIRKTSMTSSPKPLMGNWPNSTVMNPGWFSTKIVQTVSIGCVRKSRGQSIGFQNAIFKNILIHNYKIDIIQLFTY